MQFNEWDKSRSLHERISDYDIHSAQDFPDSESPIDILKSSFDKYIKSNNAPSNSVAIAIEYKERPTSKPKTMFVIRKKQKPESQKHVYVKLNNDENNQDYEYLENWYSTEKWNIANIDQVISEIINYYVLSLCLCEVYGEDHITKDGYVRENGWVIPIMILYSRRNNIRPLLSYSESESNINADIDMGLDFSKMSVKRSRDDSDSNGESGKRSRNRFGRDSLTFKSKDGNIKILWKGTSGVFIKKFDFKNKEIAKSSLCMALAMGIKQNLVKSDKVYLVGKNAMFGFQRINDNLMVASLSDISTSCGLI